jgi:DNA primase
MGKISPVSIKYIIFAKLVAKGVVEKPDVIGAIFGQTEGLLGEDLELRELQKNGKIGRIDAELVVSESQTTGTIQIPTSLDKGETTLIAAAIETIERIGPCDAKVEIEKVEDIRSSKREFVLQRAKELLGGMGTVDTREMETELTTSVRAGKIIEWGDEKLPAGPDMDNEEIIVVEGRADVLNLLKYGVKNVIAMNGASLPKTIADLSKERKLTMFIDGDRGGVLNAKDAVAHARIEYIASAPAGKEVEELAGKEILTCLRAKVPASEFMQQFEERPRRARREEGAEEKESGEGRGFRGRRFERGYSRERGGRGFRRSYREERETEDLPPVEMINKELNDKDIEKLRAMADEIEGTKAALLLDKDLNVLRKTAVGDLAYPLRFNRDKVFVLLIDGTVTNFMVRVAERTSCRYIVAKNFAVTYETKLSLLSI